MKYYKDFSRFVLAICITIGTLMSNEIEQLKINNINIPVITEIEHSLPIVSIGLLFRNTGSLRDGEHLGLATMSANLLNEGTKSKGNIAFASELESKAISIHSSNGKETFVIEIECMSEYLDDALVYLKELLQDPNLTQNTLDKLKTLTLSAISAKEDDFDYIANRNLYNIMYKNSNIANPKIGTKKSISAIKLDDIKQFLSNLTLSNLQISVGGDIKEYQNRLKNILDILPSGSGYKSIKYTPVSSTPSTTTIKKDTQQAYIYFGSKYNMKVGDEDSYKATVAFFVLGSSGFGSRLMESIRVKQGLAYSVYASLGVNLSYSLFSGHLQTKLDTSAQAINSVKDEIAKFVKNGITANELESAKKFILGSEPLRNETISQRLHTKVMNYYKGYDLDYHKTRLKQIGQLSLDDINKFIKSHNEINDLYFSVVTK